MVILRKRQVLKTELDISGGLDEVEHYDNHVVPLFNKVFNLNIKGRYFSRGTYGFVIWNIKVGSVFNDLGFPYGKKSLTVRIPRVILKGRNKLLHARFLRGLFDADSHLGFSKRTGKYIKFKPTHHYYPQ